MQYKDYYKTLGVTKTADEKAIKRAYRQLARRYHPDARPNDREAERKFKEISEAYEVLSDPEKRAKYDQLGSEWKNFDWGDFDFDDFKRQAGPDGVRFTYTATGNMDDFSDFFKVFFGGFESDPFGDVLGRDKRTGRARAERGYDSEAVVEVTLEEAFHGTERWLRTPDGCQVRVKIPAGVSNDYKVRVPGGGEKGKFGGPAGDMYLVVKIKPHPLFSVNERDLECEIPITVTEAIMGAVITIPTLKGSVSMKIPPKTQGGRIFRLRGLGLPDPKGGNTGNLMVKVKIVLPTRITEREKELYSELASLNRENPRSHLMNMVNYQMRRVENATG